MGKTFLIRSEDLNECETCLETKNCLEISKIDYLRDKQD